MKGPYVPEKHPHALYVVWEAPVNTEYPEQGDTSACWRSVTSCKERTLTWANDPLICKLVSISEHIWSVAPALTH